MLICLDCEKELRDEYAERIRKKNGIEYSNMLQHSKIKRQLLDEDNNSTFSRESYYTDNNSYNPNNEKFKINNRFKLQSHQKNDINELNIYDNFDLNQDRLSFHSYNGIITDYSKRRKKNKIKNNSKQNKEISNNYINKQKEVQDNKRKEKYRYINENDKNERANEKKSNHYNNRKQKNIFEDEERESYGDRYNDIENDDNYSNKSEKEMIINNNKNNYFNINEENGTDKDDDQDNINSNNNIKNDNNNYYYINSNSSKNINKKNKSLPNKNNDINIEINNCKFISEREENSFSNKNKNFDNIQDKKDNKGNKYDNRNYPFNTKKRNESKEKEEKESQLNDSNFQKNLNEKNILNESDEKLSQKDEIYNSIYYEKNKNDVFNDESKYIRKDKIKRKKKVNNINKLNEEYYKEQSIQDSEENELEKEDESNKNIGNIIFNNKYINKNVNNQNKDKDHYYQNNIENNNKRILYQDFYFKEVSFSSSLSSVRSSINSSSNADENNYDLRKSYPEDGKKKRITNEATNDIVPEDEFDRYIFEEINKLRENPKSFVQKIESAKKNIGVDKRNNYIYKGKQTILLNNGIYAFENAIKHLSVLRNMKKLIYNPEFNIKLPSNEEEIIDRKYQNNKVDILLKNNIKIKSFWREVIKDPEECFLLMIIDDCGHNCGVKRKDLLDPKMTSIGINSINFGKYFACYIQLGKK